MTFTQALTHIFLGLKTAIATRASRHDSDLLLRAYRRIERMATRLQTLIALWRAGTLPKPRPSQAGKPRKRAPRPPFPTGRSWLCVRVPMLPGAQGAAIFGCQLQHLMDNDAEFRAFLNDVPQAGRILRPLANMLGIGPEPPKRIRKPRPPRAKPAPPPPRPRLTGLLAPPPPRMRLQIPGLKRYWV